MLTELSFNVLYHCYKHPGSSQREIVQQVDNSLGSVNKTLKELREIGLIADKNEITDRGLTALQPYRVDNAVIMAAGLSSRFAPISYEKPKGLLTVLGDVLIERQIKQLQEAGIKDITVVLGYKKEEFFYLEDAFGVKITINPDYNSRNNNSTIKQVENILGNTYICSSDDYFSKNPFTDYVYRAYYAGVFEEGTTPEYCMITKGKERLIVDATIGGINSWTMMGHAYWDKTFSAKFVQILDSIYDRLDTAPKLWEDIYIDHLDELPMVMKPYPNDVIWEFDSLDELNAFDPEFINNVDSDILDNICRLLSCKRSDICNIEPLKQGLTNLSFKFTVNEASYVYRHPGIGTDELINRTCETCSQKIASEIGLDTTFIYEDQDKGWKVSRFIENATTLDYNNWEQVAQAMHMAQTLHSDTHDTGYSYDVFANTLALIELLDDNISENIPDFQSMLQMSEDLYNKASKHGAKHCLCHGDFYAPNFLVHNNNMQLIDWEYSGMSDYAVDLGTFICCNSDYSYDDALHVINLYFNGEPTDEQVFHCIAYTALSSFYWYVWALFKESAGDPIGEFLYTWYKFTKIYGIIAQELASKLGY